MKQSIDKEGYPHRDMKTCERCKELRKVFDIGIPGINSYNICEPCFNGMSEVDFDNLSDWIVDNA